MRISYRPSQIFAIGVALGSAATFATAQTPSGAVVLEEIVVTALRREESIQDTPLTVQAFSELQLE